MEGSLLLCQVLSPHPSPSFLLTRPLTTVFGPPALAESGQLICVLSGPSSAIKKVIPYTKGVIGRDIIDFSDEQPGKATLLKVIGNSFVFNMVETLAQGLTVAETSGLGAENLHKFIEKMFPGPFSAYSTRMMEGEYYKREEVCPHSPPIF